MCNLELCLGFILVCCCCCRQQVAGITLLELPDWYAGLEHELNLVKAAAFAFRYTEVDEEQAEDAHASKDEPDLGIQVPVSRIDDVRDRKCNHKALVQSVMDVLEAQVKEQKNILGNNLRDESDADSVVTKGLRWYFRGNDIDEGCQPESEEESRQRKHCNNG